MDPVFYHLGRAPTTTECHLLTTTTTTTTPTRKRRSRTRKIQSRPENPAPHHRQLGSPHNFPIARTAVDTPFSKSAIFCFLPLVLNVCLPGSQFGNCSLFIAFLAKQPCTMLTMSHRRSMPPRATLSLLTGQLGRLSGILVQRLGATLSSHSQTTKPFRRCLTRNS